MASHSFHDSITGAIVSGELWSGSAAEGSIQAKRAPSSRSALPSGRLRSGTIDIARALTSSIDATEGTVARVLKELGVTDVSFGLPSAEAAKRLAEGGPNELAGEEAMPLWKLILLQFLNIIILLLVAACIASFALGEVIEGIAVLIIVVLNISIAVYTEKSANDSLAALAEMSAPTCTVVRDGEATSLDSRLLVPGDILRLSMGDVVPADVRLISGVDVKTNEMPLTGESADVAKRAVDLPPSAAGSTTLTPENKLFSATTVTSGSGVGVVVATGMHTRVGQIAALLAGGEGPEGQEAPGCCAGLQGHAQRTPLQERLHRLGIYISICALLGCVLVFLIGLWRGYRDPEHPGNPPAVQLVLVSVSLAVSAVPEGLPLCVTITLAVGTSVMARVHNTLIRQLPAVESLGSVQVVCSDKTGTLTEGKMTAVKAWLPAASGAGTEVNIGPGKSLISGGGCSFTTTQGTTLLSRDPSMPADAAEASASKAAQLVSLLRSTLLNCTAQLEVQAAGQEEPHPLEEADVQELEHEVHAPPSFSVSGNATEAPLVKAAAKAGLFSYAVGAEFPPLHPTESGAEATVEVPFTSARKLMMQVVRVPEGVTTFGGVTLPADTAFLALVKGAPNYVLDLVTHTATGKKLVGPALSPASRKQVDDAIEDLSSQALRVIAVAACPLTSLPYTDEEQDTEAKLAALKGAGNWCLNGLLASIDPEREGVQEAIATAATAGVRTVMITGDYRATAVAIAKNIGLLAPTDDTDEAATDCSALRPFEDPEEYLSAVDMDEVTSRVKVFARATPRDKLEIVRSLQRQGLMVAMTGDGVNDAPALNEADIGIAMGLTGTEVAKGAADVILLDDAFTTIVQAIQRGRVIFHNIRLFVTFLLAANLSQVVIILTCVSAGIPLPLTPVGILFLNLAVGGCPAMAMSMEPAYDGVMKHPPRPRAESMLTPRALTKLLIHTAALVCAALGSFILGLHLFVGKFTIDDILPDSAGGAYPDCLKLDDAGGVTTSPGTESCAIAGIQRARALSFLVIMVSEIMRGMTVRSTQPFWVAPLRNTVLLKAQALSLALTLVFLFTPPLQKVVGVQLMPGFAWAIAAAFVVGIMFVDEVTKAFMRAADAAESRHGQVTGALGDVLLELRQLRHHVMALEDNLGVRQHRPAHSHILLPVPEGIEDGDDAASQTGGSVAGDGHVHVALVSTPRIRAGGAVSGTASSLQTVLDAYHSRMHSAPPGGVGTAK